MPDSMEKSIYFVEVQFQPKPEFYWELITEINIYLNQYKPQQDWQAVALFAKRSLDVEVLTPYQKELINSGRIKRIYLDEIPPGSIPHSAPPSVTIGNFGFLKTCEDNFDTK